MVASIQLEYYWITETHTLSDKTYGTSILYVLDDDMFFWQVWDIPNSTGPLRGYGYTRTVRGARTAVTKCLYACASTSKE